MLSIKTHFTLEDTHRLKAKGWEEAFHTKGDQKKTGMTMLIWDNIDFKSKIVSRGKEGNCYMKDQFNRKITVMPLYAHNIRDINMKSKY